MSTIFKLMASGCVLVTANLVGCCASATQPHYPTIGSVERLDPALDDLIAPGAEIEVLAEGFDWAEGPVWVEDGGFVLFSDIPPNEIHRWKAGEGCRLFLKPSGYTGTQVRGGEVGSNGLLLDREGRLVLCQHGDRRIARLTSDLQDPHPAVEYETMAGRYNNKRFNSPNDAVFSSTGELYFTDPPYGLERKMNDPLKELKFQGVYRLSRDGEVALLTKEMSRPNGIAFSPDEKTLYVANSDGKRAVWMAFELGEDGAIANSRVFFDATKWMGKRPGAPDGLKVDQHGNLWATGPGGVLIFSPQGKHLGTIRTTQRTANCAFGDDGSTLYMTADMYLLRIKLKTRGMGF